MRSYIAIATLLLAASCGSVSSNVSDGGRDGSSGGSGGSPGSGGATGTGGNQGSGGQAGGPSCDQIQTDYGKALAAARECAIDATNPCQQMASSALGCNGCTTFVNDNSGLSQFQSEWNQAGCDKNQVCTNIACLSPKSASCKASDGGGALCVDSFVSTPAASATPTN
jgi:hypothetical protein